MVFENPFQNPLWIPLDSVTIMHSGHHWLAVESKIENPQCIPLDSVAVMHFGYLYKCIIGKFYQHGLQLGNSVSALFVSEFQP